MSDLVRPEVLISRLTSPTEAWRLDAEARLIAMGEPAVEPLMRALQHASPAVRAHAVHALARIGDPRAVPVIVRALGDSENNGAVAIAAERALVEWGAPAKAALVEAATRGPEAVRPRAIRALGRVGGEELEAVLRPLLADPAPPVRTQAAAALAAALRERAIPVITSLLEDADKWVRWGVAEALVQLGSDRGEKALREAAEDPEEKGSHIEYWARDLLDEIEELRRTGRVVS